MTTTYITAIAAAAVLMVLAVMGIALSAEKRRHEREESKIRQKGAENAQRTADIITGANEIKNDANTGDHSSDIHTMADQLHDYAHD